MFNDRPVVFMLVKVFRKPPLFLSKERLQQMLMILEQKESLQELIALIKSSPELISKEAIFTVVNHSESLKTIKEHAIQGIKHSLENTEHKLEDESGSFLRHFWSIRHIENLSGTKDFSSLRKVRDFIQEVEGVIETTPDNRALLHALEDAQKVLEEGRSLRKRNRKDLEEVASGVVEEIKALEREFQNLPMALDALLAKMGWIELQEELSSIKGSSYLEEVDRIIGLLQKDFSKENAPIQKDLGFGWGVFLNPIAKSFEIEDPKECIEEEISFCELYRDLVKARKEIEPYVLAFTEWFDKKKEKLGC